jgi:hypothetical protein
MWPTLRPGDQVTVEPVAADALQAGDWVLLRGNGGLFLHRFLGFTREGLLLTKGDGRRSPDPPWFPEDLQGRAVALSRQGRTIPISPVSFCERVRTAVHRLMAVAWSLLRRVVFPVFLLAVAAATARAAVVLKSFEAIPEDQMIRVTWQTASEVKMSYFCVQRATQEEGQYERISDEIEAEGDLFGWVYSYDDTDVVAGQTYYYRLEAVETGGSTEFHGPISATIPPDATGTPTPTPRSSPPLPPPTTSTPTPSATPEPTSAAATPSATPVPPSPTPSASTPTLPTATPTPQASADASGSPTPTASPTPQIFGSSPSHTPSPTPTQPPRHTPLPTRTPASLPASTATPSPTPARLPIHPEETKTTPWLSWELVLALVGIGSGLLLLGGWGLWRTRYRE